LQISYLENRNGELEVGQNEFINYWTI